MAKWLWATIAVVGLAAGVLAAQSVAVDELFEEGNQYYADKKYSEALARYEQLVAEDLVSPELYYNLGNAYFKSGDLGNAIVNYLRAQRLDPGNEDIRHNLEFARRFARVQMEGVELNPVSAMIGSFVETYSLKALAWVSSVLFVLLILALMFRWGLAFSSTGLRATVTALTVLCLISAGLTTFKYRTEYLTRRAVIVAEDSPVYTGASQQSEIELQGAPGLVVEILEESGEFYNVLFENKRRGWIEKDLVAEV